MSPIVWIMLIWAVTTIMSFWMIMHTVLEMVVEFANNGWLLNSKKIHSVSAGNNATTLLMFVPVVNIGYGFFLKLSYVNNLRSLAATSSVIADPMTKEEQEAWDADPRAITALRMISNKAALYDNPPENVTELLVKRRDELKREEALKERELEESENEK